MNEINFNVEDIKKIDLSMDVGVKEIYPPIENLEVTPTKQEQVFNHENSYGYDKVIVEPIPDEYIIPDGTLEVGTNGDVDVTAFKTARVGVYVPPTLQEKEVTPTTSNQNIVADSGYDGLSSVNVIGDSELVSENIKKDVEIFGVKGSLEAAAKPTKGFIINEWTENGYVKKLTTIGFDRLPAAYFESPVSGENSKGGLFQNLEEIELNEGITSIENSFRNLYSLKRINIPSTLSTLYYSFYNCDLSEIKTIPDTVKTINGYAFYQTNITQLSIPSSVINFAGTSSYLAGIKNNKSLIATWVGNGVTSLGRYCFDGCSALKRMYIDLPRATVEAFGGYSYKFVNSTSSTVEIICNDDEGFITKEQFDATDWTTTI